MQTFLPYPSFSESAKALDPRRLGKQRAEVIQILDALHEIPTADGKPYPLHIANHPATRMWRGHEPALAVYGLAIVEEWVGRGYKDNVCETKISQHLQWATDGDYTMACPSWFGDADFHLAHQSNLLRKDPHYYGDKFPGVPLDLPYIWPVP